MSATPSMTKSIARTFIVLRLLDATGRARRGPPAGRPGRPRRVEAQGDEPTPYPAVAAPGGLGAPSRSSATARPPPRTTPGAPGKPPLAALGELRSGLPALPGGVVLLSLGRRSGRGAGASRLALRRPSPLCADVGDPRAAPP